MGERHLASMEPRPGLVEFAEVDLGGGERILREDAVLKGEGVSPVVVARGTATRDSDVDKQASHVSALARN